MRHRKLLQFEKPNWTQPPAPTGRIVTVDAGMTGRATARLPAGFEDHGILQLLPDEAGDQPVRRSVEIRWLETDELHLEINRRHWHHS
jgi:hypothetical protein